MEISIEIDEVTNCLIETSTSKECETEYHLIDNPISKKEARKLMFDGWLFDWNDESNKKTSIYKLTLKNDKTIQGLISLNYDKENYAVYVSLVESAPHNRVDKKYLGVGLHLFAIACKLSFEAKFDGYVHFVSKSSLIKHYVSKLNAKQIGGRKMLIETKEAKLLVQKYFKETC